LPNWNRGPNKLAPALKAIPLAVMHGTFKHHIDHPSVPTLDQEFYGNVADLIIIGHNHIYKKYKNIHTPGSFTRDRFGEETPKGGLFIAKER